MEKLAVLVQAKVEGKEMITLEVWAFLSPGVQNRRFFSITIWLVTFFTCKRTDNGKTGSCIEVLIHFSPFASSS